MLNTFYNRQNAYYKESYYCKIEDVFLLIYGFELEKCLTIPSNERKVIENTLSVGGVLGIVSFDGRVIFLLPKCAENVW
jgi:hypothetical protein